MRVLVLMRGLPACGKSTFIKEKNLEPYTLSTDTLKELYSGLILNIEGEQSRDIAAIADVTKIIHTVLESRLQRGVFTVIDATHTRTKDMITAVTLAKEYRYKVYCVDFTDVSVDECIERDAQRKGVLRVGSAVIHKLNHNLKDNIQMPKGVEVLKPPQWGEVMQYTAEDLGTYKRVHHIGDVHGCNTVLQEYLAGGLKEDEFYIFLGDYVDRGLENVEVIKFLSGIAEQPNVVLLEGNHEQWLNCFVNGLPAKSEEFEKKTKIAFHHAGVEELKTMCSKIVRKLHQCFLYTYAEKTVLCTHGGLSGLPKNLLYVPTSQMVKGVGSYGQMQEVNDAFARNVGDAEIYQVHGHRNVEKASIQLNKRCFNLNGDAELGGSLRALTLDEQGFKGFKIENLVYDRPEVVKFVGVEDMLQAMKEDEFVNMKQQRGTDIVALNFNREAFKEGRWNQRAMKARGLFVNEKTQKIVARGYEKYFNIGERADTDKDIIGGKLAYPVTAYVKENGFLGILGYDATTTGCKLLYCSKTQVHGEYSRYFKEIILAKVEEERLTKLVSQTGVSLAFEVIDTQNDPHIIKYPQSKVVLLDVIENTIDFKTIPYEELEKIGSYLGVEVKRRAVVLETREALDIFVSDAQAEKHKWQGEYIEGYVFEDALGKMYKLKTQYYKDWKCMRTQVTRVRNGGETQLSNAFLKWVQEKPCYLIRTKAGLDIIQMREHYTKETGKESIASGD